MADKTADESVDRKLQICPRHDGTKGQKFTKWTRMWLDAAEGRGDEDASLSYTVQTVTNIQYQHPQGQHAAELAPNARATPLIHALACRSSHAAAPELLGDMQRPPWHEIIDEQTCADPAAANMKASVMSIC